MLTILTWFWGDKFDISYVKILAASVRRHLKRDHKFIVVTDCPSKFNGDKRIDFIPFEHGDHDLAQRKGCFVRLKMFSPEWQANPIFDGSDQFVCIDLDTVIIGPLDPLFERAESFVIMQGGNAVNPCPFNGALQMLRRGQHPEVWSDFSVKAASKIAFHSFPDDQGWLWTKIPNAAGWTCGAETGVYVFRKPGWPGWADLNEAVTDEQLPKRARLVTFSGWRNPRKFSHLSWVANNWRV